MASAIVLAGCVATPTLDRAKISSDKAILDKPLENAIRALGVPADDKTITGRRVISWRIGGGSDSYECQLRAVVDKDEVIRKTEIDGRIVACDAWLKGVK